MTTTTQSPASGATPEPDPPRTTRLGNWISQDAHRRLALYKTLTGTGVGLTLDRLVRLHLPCVADLSQQLAGAEGSADDA